VTVTQWTKALRTAAVASLVSLAGTAATAETGTADVLTLDEAVALALQNNRGVGVAAAQVQRAERKVEAARTRRLPSVEVQALAGTTVTPIRTSFPEGAFGSYPGIGPIPGSDTVVEVPQTLSGTLNASVAQPLTQLHKIGLNTKMSELARDVEKEKLRGERAAVAAQVRGLFYSLLQTQSALGAKQEQVRTYRELDRVVGQQVAIEVALRSDGLGVQAQLAAEEYRLAGLEDQLATGCEQMNQLLGRDLGREFTLAEVSETSIEEADLPQAVAHALQRRPDLTQARLAVEQADTDRRLKAAESLPDISLAFSYYTFANVDFVPHNIAQVGLQLKWEPFDWGRRGKEKAEKTLQVEQARANARDAEDKVRIEVGRQFRALRQARLLVAAERLDRQAAEETLRVVTTRHAVDAALVKDVLDAQAATSAAHARYDQALMQFWTAKADFQKAIGEEQ
jgi:outer membrane protein TolC